ncbi:MAG: hypothetical protein SGPRY_004480 [Prymnesium sp.]
MSEPGCEQRPRACGLTYLARAVGSNARVDAAGERATVRTSLPGVVKRICVALVSAVQKTHTRIPTRDDVGLKHLALDAARKLAAAAVVGKLSLPDFSKEARGILGHGGHGAPAKGSLEELRAAWRLMRAALLAVASPLYGQSEFDDGCSGSAMRVMESWENACVEFRQAGAATPELSRCIQEHDQYLNWTAATATVKEELRAELGKQPALAPGRGRGKGENHHRSRAGGAAGQKEAEETRPSELEQEGVGVGAGDRHGRGKDKRTSAWPDKPRLDAERFKAFKTETREKCPDACTPDRALYQNGMQIQTRDATGVRQRSKRSTA